MSRSLRPRCQVRSSAFWAAIPCVPGGVLAPGEAISRSRRRPTSEVSYSKRSSRIEVCNMALGGAETAILGKILEEVVEHSVENGRLDQLKAALRRRQNVLLLGSTGTGKSNLRRAIKRETVDIPISDRTMVVENERIRITDHFFKIHDTPGDISLDGQRQKAYRAHLRQREPIILNVVSYGYHEYPAGQEQSPLTATGRPSALYLRAHRQIEMDMLGEWLGLLDPALTKFVLTIVTKADLWYANRVEVLKHYRSGEYSRLLREAGWRNTSVLPYSSVFHRFFDDGVVPGFFGDSDRKRTHTIFLRDLVKLAVSD